MTKEESGELWGRIREEYIQSDLSLRKLSEKYGVSKQQLERRSAREGWPALRERSRASGGAPAGNTARHLEETVEKMLKLLQQDFEDQQQFHRYLVKTKGAEELEERIFRKLDTKALKEVTAALKDLKAMVQGGEDDQDNQVRVVFEAGEEDWNE